jgi:hypothetical protein
MQSYVPLDSTTGHSIFAVPSSASALATRFRVMVSIYTVTRRRAITCTILDSMDKHGI